MHAEFEFEKLGMLQIIKTTHDFFKGSLSNLSHLRQVMLQQNH
jgi:hypothetical protein